MMQKVKTKCYRGIMAETWPALANYNQEMAAAKNPEVVEPLLKVSVRNRFMDMWTYFYSLKLKL